MTAGRPWWKKMRWWAAALVLLAVGASVRYERAEYRDGAGNVARTRSAVLLPWERLPPVEGDKAGSVTRRGSVVFGLVKTERREVVTLRRIGGREPVVAPKPAAGAGASAGCLSFGLII